MPMLMDRNLHLHSVLAQHTDSSVRLGGQDACLNSGDFVGMWCGRTDLHDERRLAVLVRQLHEAHAAQALHEQHGLRQAADDGCAGCISILGCPAGLTHTHTAITIRLGTTCAKASIKYLLTCEWQRACAASRITATLDS